MVDLIVIVWLILVFANGWEKGIVRTLIGPASFVACGIVSYIYFRMAHDAKGFLLGITVAPVAVSILASFLLVLWHQNVSKGAPARLFSKLSASLINLFWGFGMIILGVFTLAIFSANNPRLEGLHQKILDSYSYTFVDRFVKDKIPFVRNIEAVTSLSQSPEKLVKIQSTPEFQAVYRDGTFRSIFSDRKTMAQIQQKDLTGLLQNPKFKAMWEDEEFKKKIAKLFVAIEELDQTEHVSQIKVRP